MSITFSTVTSFIRGVNIASTLHQCKVEEDIQIATRHFVMPTLIQTVEVYTAFQTIQEVFNALNNAPFTSFNRVRMISLVIPILTTATSRSMKNTHPFLSRTVYLLHNHIGNLCQAATALSSIALIVFGKFALGTSTLLILGIGFLSRFRVLPTELRSYLNQSNFLITNICRLVLGNFVEKTLAITDIAFNAIELLQNVKEKQIFENVDFSTVEKSYVEKIVQIDDVEVNPDHQLHAELYIPKLENDVNLNELNNIVNSIDFEKNKELLKDIRSNPVIEGFLKYNLINLTSEEILKKGIFYLVDSFENHRFKVSEPKDYYPIEQKLKHIICYLSESNDEKLKILIKLGVASYSYPGELIWVIDEVYAETQKTKSQKSFFYFHLQKLRDKIFEDEIKNILDIKKNYPILTSHKILNTLTTIVMDAYDLEDKHLVYYFMNSLGSKFGLTHTLGARNEQFAMKNANYEFLHYLWYYSKALNIRNQYSKERILDTAKTAKEEFESSEENLVKYLVEIGVFKLKSHVT